MRNHLVLISILIIPSLLFSQDKISYKLTKGYSQQSLGSIDYFVKPNEPIEFKFQIKINGFSDRLLTGKVQTYISIDSVLSSEDKLVGETTVELDYYASEEFDIDKEISAGGYYLLTQLSANDTTYFKAVSNTLVQLLTVYEFNLVIEKALVYDYQISDYNKESGFAVTLNFDAGCCYDSTLMLSSEIVIYSSSSKTKKRASNSLATFYEDLRLGESPIRLELSNTIFESIGAAKGKFLHVELKGYVQPGYTEIDPIVVSIPTTYCNTIGKLNEAREAKYPFLTFRDFVLTPNQLEGLFVDTLLQRGQAFYDWVNDAMEAGIRGDYATYLSAADSAFALAGRNPISTVLYVQTGIMSDLYVNLSKRLDEEQAYASPFTQEEVSFRLGVAMTMEEMIELAYNKLTDLLFDDDISISNSVEETGFYEDNISYPPIILNNPIFWKEVSLPYLESAMRRFDFETVDRMVYNLDQYAVLYEKTWKYLGQFQEKFGEEKMAGSLVEYNSMMDYYLLKLGFYTETGQYVRGLGTYKTLMLLLKTSFQWSSDEILETSGRFFETFGHFNTADSLYQLADWWSEKDAEEMNDKLASSVRLLKAYNTQVLQSKLGDKPNKQITKEYVDHLLLVLDKAFIFDQFKYTSNKAVAEKLGHLHTDRFFKYYQSNIDRLNEQNQWIISATWQKNLAFFLGREGYTKEALFLYSNLLFYEQLKMRAFRASFSEESQVFYAKKELESFSRYLNLLLEVDPATLVDPSYEQLLTEAFNQAMDYHSFILRGNYRLIAQIFESDDEEIAMKYEVWKAYKQLLNQQYFEDDADQRMIREIKNNIERTEKELIRNTRDSSAVLGREVLNFDEIRKRLKPQEVAIEMLRITENHQTYYGDKLRYVAFLVTPDQDFPELIFNDNDGDLMESTFLKKYRSSIKYKLRDTTSYRVFWKDLDERIPKGTKTLYFVQDGVYQLINPSSIYVPEQEQFLLEKYDIQLLPSLSFLNSENNDSIQSAVIFGNPTFIKNPTKSSANSVYLNNRSALFKRQIQSLPGTKKEVEAIADLLKRQGLDVQLFTEREVTKENFFTSEGVDLLHIATHGYWTDSKKESPVYSIYKSLSNSGLILADAQSRSETGYNLNSKGLLTAAEIQNMVSFGTELVVLSACETGLGEIVPGEGIFGLKRAFQKAGVSNLISTLWKVDDDATQKFMTLFYTSLTKTNRFRRVIIIHITPDK